jgi:hypothetical protein
MNRFMFLLSSTMLLRLPAAIQTARAEDPPQDAVLAVRYTIHEVATDPDSPVIWTVDLGIQEANRLGDFVAWQVTAIRVTRNGPLTGQVRSWLDVNPTVETSDGLWWVAHVDPNSVERSEFDLPPLTSGVAEPDPGTDSELVYSFAGQTLDPPPGSPLDGVPSTNLSYALSIENSADPTDDEEQEETEPATIDDPGTPPDGQGTSARPTSLPPLAYVAGSLVRNNSLL